MAVETGKRSRGRPHGGGNTADQSSAALLDAAERSLMKRGCRASTIEAIACEAGYSRTIVYRHFATRDELMDAVMMRRTGQLVAKIYRRQGDWSDAAGSLVDAVAVFVTELAHDPIFLNLAEQTLTSVSVRTSLAAAVETRLIGLQHSRGGPLLRAGIRPIDAAQSLITATMSILSGLVPGVEDEQQLRRYVRVFVLPSILAEPPPGEPVFAPL